MTADVSPVERWLARAVLRAETLSAVAVGSVDRARSSLSSGAIAHGCRDCRWQVDGGKVRYSHLEHGDGTVTVRRLIAVAAAQFTDEKAQRLTGAYRAYVDEAINRRVPYPRDREGEPEQLAQAEAHFGRYCAASRALEAATAAWWTFEKAAPVQGGLFDLEAVAL